MLLEDEPAFQYALAKLTPEEIRLRFFTPIKTLTHVQAGRFTQIDCDREMALVLAEPGIPAKPEVVGVARITADPDNERPEYAIIVRHDMTGMGLGLLLMRRSIDYAKKRGIGEIFGDVLRENVTMLRMCEALGFIQTSVPEEPGLVRVVLDLRGAPGAARGADVRAAQSPRRSPRDRRGLARNPSPPDTRTNDSRSAATRTKKTPETLALQGPFREAPSKGELSDIVMMR